MSISICTMGMFTPAGGGTRVEYIELDRGGSDGWWLRNKIQVVVRSVIESNEEKPIIEVIKVTNGSA